jgi:hypothetical protein
MLVLVPPLTTQQMRVLTIQTARQRTLLYSVMDYWVLITWVRPALHRQWTVHYLPEVADMPVCRSTTGGVFDRCLSKMESTSS